MCIKVHIYTFNLSNCINKPFNTSCKCSAKGRDHNWINVLKHSDKITNTEFLPATRRFFALRLFTVDGTRALLLRMALLLFRVWCVMKPTMRNKKFSIWYLAAQQARNDRRRRVIRTGAVGTHWWRSAGPGWLHTSRWLWCCSSCRLDRTATRPCCPGCRCSSPPWPCVTAERHLSQSCDKPQTQFHYGPCGAAASPPERPAAAGKK